MVGAAGLFVLPALLGAFMWGNVNALDKSNLVVPQTPQEKVEHVQRVKLPCLSGCDPVHYMYVLRETD